MEKKIFGTSLEAKARILVFNIACGLLSLAVVSYVFYFSLKYDYETLFSEYHQSLIGLEELRQIVNGTQAILMQPNQESQMIELREKIIEYWEAYQRVEETALDDNYLIYLVLQVYYFFNQDDFGLKEEAEMQQKIDDISKLDNQIYIFLDILKKASNNQENYIEDLKYQIAQLNKEISNLIHSSLNLVEIKKDRNSTLHSILHKAVLAIMCLIMVITIWLSYLVLSNIKLLHKTLEIKIKEKTKELRDLNDSLQETIKKEVLESRKKDQIMYQQARLASMGEMIGNIAHQWRQPLNALMLLIQAFKVKSQNGKLTQEFIEVQVEEGLKIAKRMSRTIEDFRNFFHSSSQKEFFNLRENIEDSVSLVSAFLKQNEIQLEIECPNDIVLYGYKNSFSQVILNLIKNSEDVLKERNITPAKIKISVSQDNKNNVLPKNNKQGGCVQILFMDNGGGVRLEDIQKIFEPYFTTKHKSVGTGIGLYMSKQIIEKQMQGSIEVKNVKWQTDYECQKRECLENCQVQSGECGAQFIITIPLKIEE